MFTSPSIWICSCTDKTHKHIYTERKKLHLGILAMTNPKKKTIPSIAVLKRIKYFVVSLTREVKDLYTRSYKIVCCKQLKEGWVEK